MREQIAPSIPAAISDDFALLRAKRVEHQTSLMYLMLLATTPTAAWAGAASVHWSIRFGFPAVLAIVCMIGMIENRISRRRRMSVHRARRIVDRTSRVSATVAVMCSLWAVVNWLASPPVHHASFVMILTMGSLATAYCLSSIRLAAILNLVIGVVPIAMLMLSSGIPAEIGAATSLVLATAILIRFILQGHAMLVDMLQLQQQMRDLAHTDPLTGLANRRAMDDALAALVTPRVGAPEFRLAVLDLDGFKPVNDRFGHATGDKLLCSVAQRLRECCGDDTLVSRQGGDEFAILVPPDSRLHAASIADHILAALVRPHLIEGMPIAVGASIGVAQWPTDGATGDHLFEFADRALYAAKSAVQPGMPLIEGRAQAA